MFDLIVVWVLVFLVMRFFYLIVVWVLLVDCVRIAEFDHGFVGIFVCLVAKKMQENRRKA